MSLLANRTEFGKTPFFTAARFPHRTGRARDGSTQAVIERCRRAQPPETIGLHDYGALDASIVRTVLP